MVSLRAHPVVFCRASSMIYLLAVLDKNLQMTGHYLRLTTETEEVHTKEFPYRQCHRKSLVIRIALHGVSQGRKRQKAAEMGFQCTTTLTLLSFITRQTSKLLLPLFSVGLSFGLSLIPRPTAK